MDIATILDILWDDAFSPQSDVCFKTMKRCRFIYDAFVAVQTLGIHIPKRFATDQMQQGTLLDGELVTDVVKRKDEYGNIVSERVARYLVYDGICIDEISIVTLNLLERLRRVYQHVVEPRREWAMKFPEEIKKEKDQNQFLDIYLKVCDLKIKKKSKRLSEIMNIFKYTLKVKFNIFIFNGSHIAFSFLLLFNN